MRMLRFPIMALAGLSLAACAIAPPASAPSAPAIIQAIPAAPVVAADKIILDEQIGQAVELAYKGFRLSLELAVDLGKVKGERAAQAQLLNRRAFAATQATQAAYRSLNASSYRAAAAEAMAAIRAGSALIEGK